SILWEWLHKDGKFTADDAATGVRSGDRLSADLFGHLLEEEYGKLLRAKNKDVHDDSKTTTLPIAREIVRTYVAEGAKIPWYIDLLNINLNNRDLDLARKRILLYLEAFRKDGTRITENLDFQSCGKG
ncbi:MAG TPA: malate synthase, partial [Bacteroidota bacterium]|nr:malate synthase [Bacteroidota bacterium]